nr:NADH:flavin oxidoreductase/NADH oxidase [Candidatus Eremiobacteraeota bacterium]
LVHLGSRAVGGAGLVFTEATAVSAAGRISPGDLGIYHDAHIDRLREITRFIHEHGAVAGIQLAHAGFKASTSPPWAGGNPLTVDQGGWRPIYSSGAAPFKDGWIVPHALTPAEISVVIAEFVRAAERAIEAGFGVIEIHAAHGYLLHEFLSPISNRRTDSYGGSFENRIQMLCDLVKAMRLTIPQVMPLIVRISATDWIEGGWTGEDSVKLARILKTLGVDLIDCSSGGISPAAKIPLAPGYQVPFARAVRTEAAISTGAVGLITQAHQAQEIISSGAADIVLLARELLRQPYWPLLAAAELRQTITWPQQYERAKPA